MRVAQVSAHYPPNFVSGGTLVPQRVARAVAAAGHDSFVFAGRLDEAGTPLTRFSEDDGFGVSVTWLVTTPWTSWSDERNYDNPEATEAFAAWLERVRPDVVHVHSLQTLGIGFLRAAGESGARVILTMHDFWWYCSRQFLVDRSMRPCSLVVSCGECECEAGRTHLERRNSILRTALEHVDVVLAPSAAARDVLVANGLPEGLVRVDENGLPDDQIDEFAPGVGRTSSGDHVRLMFAGGDQPMKGPDVLVDALRSLGELRNVGIDLYGINDQQARGLPTWARARDRFKPDQLQQVLQAHDVLVLPSVMRESHSILTREALAAGLAVLCTDTLGPEEAVRHGFNGLIVPAADMISLAESIRRLAENPDLVASLKGHGSASGIRRFSEQAEGLLRLYAEVAEAAGLRVAGEAKEGESPRLRSVLFVVGIQGAPLRYRAQLPAEGLALSGIASQVLHYRDPQLPGRASEADAVVFYRVPATEQVIEVIAAIRARREAVPIIFDVDDLIFDPGLENQLEGLDGLSEEDRALWWRGVARYRTTMEACDMYVGSTEELCRQATEVTGLPSRRFANGVGLLLARRSDRERRRERAPGPIRMGYFSGTTTHDADWATIESAVISVLSRHPEVELWLGGHLRTTPALDVLGGRVRRLPFVPWFELPGVLRDTDICLAPLTPDSRFNEAKSAIKWLEAALVETPTVCTPTEPFREAIDHGRTGFLATTTDEWIDALEVLVGSEAERRRIGSQARREALLRWSPHRQGAIYRSILEDARRFVEEQGHREATSWDPVMDDEPFSEFASVVEDYSIPGDPGRPVGGHRDLLALVRRMLGRTREVLSEEGPRGLSARLWRRAATARALAKQRFRR